MNSARWILPAAALLLLGGAGGAAWKIAQDRKDEANSRGGSAGARSVEDGGKPSRSSRRNGAEASPFASLPPHLKKLVLEIEEEALAMEDDDEITHKEMMAGLAALKPALEGVVLEDLKMLIAYYKNPDAKIGKSGYGVVFEELFKRWGRLDPEGASEYVSEELRRAVASLKEAIDFFDPFGSSETRVFPGEIAAVFAGWSQMDPIAARNGWKDIHERILNNPMVRDSDSVNYQVLAQISSTWSSAAPRESWRYLRENIAEVSGDWVQGFVAGLGEEVPWSELAGEYAELADDKLTVYTPSLAARWARYEPNAAVDWIVEASPESVGTMFGEWHRENGEDAWSWLEQNNGNLQDEVLVAATRAALDHRSHRIEEVLALAESLPQTDGTWELVVDLANGKVPGTPFAEELEPERVRELTERLGAPEEIRRAVEAGIEDRGGL